MKKIIYLFLFLITILWFSFADKIIVLTPWWNVVSTPNLLSWVDFSNEGAWVSFYSLVWGSWVSVIPTATTIVPLEWYVVNNSNTWNVSMSLIYKTNVSPMEILFQKTLNIGWNFLWITTETSPFSNIGDSATMSVDFTKSSISNLSNWVNDGITVNNTSSSLSSPELWESYWVFVTSPWAIYWWSQSVNSSGDNLSLSASGSEIISSFDVSSLNEIQDNTDDVYFGTLNLESQGTNYKMTSYTLKITTIGGNVEDIVGSVTLNGVSYSSSSSQTWSTATFTYENINLYANTSVSLPIYVDILDVLTGVTSVEVSADLDGNVNLQNLDNLEEYFWTGANDYFTSIDFFEKTISIEEASLMWTEMALNSGSIILWNQEETVYAAKINIWNIDDVKLDDATFTVAYAGSDVTKDLTDLVQEATLEIGGESYNDDSITANTIKFRNMAEVIDAGESNVDVYLTLHLKSIDGYTGVITEITLTDSDADNSNGDEVILDVTDIDSNDFTLLDNGDLAITVELDDDNGTIESESVEYNKFAVAGSNDRVVLGKYKLDASDEDMDIDEMTFAFSGVEFDDSVDAYKLVIDNDETLSYTNLVSGAIVSVEFTNVDFTVDTSTNSYAYLYAMIKDIDLDSEVVESQANIGALLETLTIDSIEFEGTESGDDETEITAAITNGSMTTTVVASDIVASVLEWVEHSTLINGSNIIATFTVTPVDTDNTNEEGDILYPILEELNATITFINATWTYLIRKVWGVNVGGLNSAGLSVSLSDDAEIDGETIFEIVANVIVTNPAVDAFAQVKIVDITEDVEYFQSETLSWENMITQFVAKWISKELIVNTQ